MFLNTSVDTEKKHGFSDMDYVPTEHVTGIHSIDATNSFTHVDEPR